jgi:hypothetical protein
MSKEKDYKAIQKYLETQIKKNDISSIEQYVRSHNDDILEIYYKFGSGNEYLRTPYNAVCFSHPDIALKYQELLETTIAGDVLFSDE